MDEKPGLRLAYDFLGYFKDDSNGPCTEKDGKWTILHGRHTVAVQYATNTVVTSLCLLDKSAQLPERFSYP